MEKIVEQKVSQVVWMREKGKEEEDTNDTDETLTHYVTSGIWIKLMPSFLRVLKFYSRVKLMT